MNQHQEIAIAALRAMRGDDTARYRRYRMAFRNHSAEDMQKPYGQSGKTCAQILAESAAP